MDRVRKIGLGEPTLWWVCFSTHAMTWWANLIPGKYKHVRVAGYHPGADAVVFYDVGLTRTVLSVGIGDDGFNALGGWLVDHDVVTFRPIREPDQTRWFFRLGFWCVPAIKHLLGVRSGALRPDTLMRDLLRCGASAFEPEKTIGTVSTASAGH